MGRRRRSFRGPWKWGWRGWGVRETFGKEGDRFAVTFEYFALVVGEVDLFEHLVDAVLDRKELALGRAGGWRSGFFAGRGVTVADARAAWCPSS